MAKRSGAYKSEKRKKELMRQKKQEKKRQKRLSKGDATADAESFIPENTETGQEQEPA